MERRKELIQEYKNRKPNMGVYQIRNKINGKIQILSSLNLDGAFNRFQFELKMGLNMGPWEKELKADLARYGPENFVFEVLDKLKPVEEPDYDYREDLKALEELWLEKLEPYGERGYNKRKG